MISTLALTKLAIFLAVCTAKAKTVGGLVSYINEMSYPAAPESERNKSPAPNQFTDVVIKNKHGTSQYLDVSELRKTKAFFDNMRHLKQNDAGFGRRDFSIPTKGLVNENQLIDSYSTRYSKSTDVDRQMEDLKGQIVNTTLEIDRLYKSLMEDGKSESSNSSAGGMADESHRVEAGSNRALTEAGGQGGKKNCCDSDEIDRLKDNIRIEKEVRNQMIRFLAKAKMENSRLSKALGAILKYYRPDEKVLKNLGISSRLKRVILAERIRMLPKSKRRELAKRLNNLKRRTNR